MIEIHREFLKVKGNVGCFRKLAKMRFLPNELSSFRVGSLLLKQNLHYPVAVAESPEAAEMTRLRQKFSSRCDVIPVTQSPIKTASQVPQKLFCGLGGYYIHLRTNASGATETVKLSKRIICQRAAFSISRPEFRVQVLSI